MHLERLEYAEYLGGGIHADEDPQLAGRIDGRNDKEKEAQGLGIALGS